MFQCINGCVLLCYQAGYKCDAKKQEMMPKQPTYDFNKLDYDVTTDQPLDHEV